MTEEEIAALNEKAHDLRDGGSLSEQEEEQLERDDTPAPKRRTTKRKTTKRRAPRQPSNKPPSLYGATKAMIDTVGQVWHMSEATRGHVQLDEDYPTCGSVLLAQSQSIAQNLNTLAQSDPNVYKWLDRMLHGGGWGGVVLATWPVAQAILAAHVMPGIAKRREGMIEETVEPEGPQPWASEQPT
jgi:hypothetical protein